MPTRTNVAGCGTRPGARRCRTMPSAPPPQPPITIDGPKTPPQPPLPMVRPVVRILPTATARSKSARPRLASPAGGDGEGVLEDAVAERQHGQRLLVPEGEVQDQAQDGTQE